MTLDCFVKLEVRVMLYPLKLENVRSLRELVDHALFLLIFGSHALRETGSLRHMSLRLPTSAMVLRVPIISSRPEGSVCVGAYCHC